MSSKADRAKGKIKEVAGTAVDKPRLEREGKVDQVGARVKKIAEDTASKVNDVVDDTKDRVRKATNRK